MAPVSSRVSLRQGLLTSLRRLEGARKADQLAEGHRAEVTAPSTGFECPAFGRTSAGVLPHTDPRAGPPPWLGLPGLPRPRASGMVTWARCPQPRARGKVTVTRSGISLLGEPSLGSSGREGRRWLWRKPAGETPRPPPGTGTHCSSLHPTAPTSAGPAPPLGSLLGFLQAGSRARRSPWPPGRAAWWPWSHCHTADWARGSRTPQAPITPPLSVSRDLEEGGLLPLMPTQRRAPRSGP